MKKIFLIAILLVVSVGMTFAQGNQYEYNAYIYYKKANTPYSYRAAFDHGITTFGYDGVSVNATETLFWPFANVESVYYMENKNNNYTGLDDISAVKMNAYINNGMLHINAANNIGSVVLYSISGSLMLKQVVKSTTADINVSSLPQGTYVLVIDGKNSKKLIKK